MPDEPLQPKRNQPWLIAGGVLALLCIVCGCVALVAGGYYFSTTGKLPPALPVGTGAPSVTTPTGSETAGPASGANPGYDTAKLYAGEWDGPWNNTTFGSQGTAKATITVNPDGTASIALDLTGNALGHGTAPSLTINGSYDANGFVFKDQGNLLFGNLTINISFAGSMDMSADTLPVTGITKVSSTGTMSSQDAKVSYQVDFSNGQSAAGTAHLTHAP
jgi:hypothetical protein